MSAAALVLSALLAAPASPPPSPAEPRHSTRVLRDATQVQDPTLRREFRRAQAMGDAGLTLGVTGLAVGALVTLPAWFVYRADLERAEDRKYRVEQEAPLDDARRRLRVVQISAAVSGLLVVAGTTLAVVGYRRRARIWRAGDRLTLSPSVGTTHYGATATLRF